MSHFFNRFELRSRFGEEHFFSEKTRLQVFLCLPAFTDCYKEEELLQEYMSESSTEKWTDNIRKGVISRQTNFCMQMGEGGDKR